MSQLPTTTEAHVARTSRETLSAGEKTWHEVDKIRAARYDEAREQLGNAASPADVLSLAYANQLAFLDSFTEDELEELTTHELTAERLVLLLCETPAAAAAIRKLDNANGQLTRADRTNTAAVASQFNQDLSAVLTYMPKSMISGFSEEFLERSNRIAVACNVESLSGDRLRRSMSGMACEVAFGRALRYNKPDEWTILPPSVMDDVRGMDVRMREGELEIAIDLKNDDGFLRKLNKVNATPYERAYADENGYIKIGDVFVVNADQLGKIKDFEYVEQLGTEDSAVILLVRNLFLEQRRDNLRKLSRSVINKSA